MYVDQLMIRLIKIFELSDILLLWLIIWLVIYGYMINLMLNSVTTTNSWHYSFLIWSYNYVKFFKYYL